MRKNLKTKNSKDKTERRTRAQKNTRKIRRQSKDSSLYFSIWAGVIIIAMILVFIFAQQTSTQKRKRNISEPNVEEAKKNLVEGIQFLRERNFIKAEKILKKSKKILDEAHSFYQDNPPKLHEIDSLLQKVNESYYQAYKNSTIK